MKRLFDLCAAALGLLIATPVLLVVMFLIWRDDRASPFYVSHRIGKNRIPFRMVKLRSMRVGADKTGVSSTSANDARITSVGHFLRTWKLDELVQLWNVLKGDMSVVGPRPNVGPKGVDLYTSTEMRLLSVRPGITDLSSIVFSDEGEILSGSADPDRSYEELIRPWKSRLGLMYIDNRSFLLDLKIIWWTILGIVSRQQTLDQVSRTLSQMGAPPELCAVARREAALVRGIPPGSSGS